MRLIDAEKLWLTTEYTEDGKVHKYYEQFEVDEQPTIDAEPVRHGKWIYQEYKGIKHQNIGYYVCSKCARMMLRNNYLYCPWCGARMNEVNDE